MVDSRIDKRRASGNILRDRIRYEILDFIKNHPNTSRNPVVKHIQEKGLSSHMTIINIIDSLIEDKIIKFTKKSYKGFYHLSLNDKSVFNELFRKMGDILEFEKRLIADYDEYKSRSSSEEATVFDGYFINIIGFLQRFLNKKINDIVLRIAKIKSTEDREFLYSRLIDILIINNRLNDVEAPYMVEDLRNMLNEMISSQGGESDITNKHDKEVIVRIRKSIDEVEQLVAAETTTSSSSLSV